MTLDPTLKMPRLYISSRLAQDDTTILGEDPTHYLRNVLRRNIGDGVRLFNGQDGEWLGRITQLSKKETHLNLERCLHAQPSSIRKIHLYFAPIKKSRLDFMIEKSVELGVTDLHPVLTQNTENRNLNIDRTQAQIIEATEQCERLDLPILHPVTDLQKLKCPGLLVCLERTKDSPGLAQTLKETIGPIHILIGPEGGFSAAEQTWLAAKKDWKSVHLGPHILRAETAACAALSLILGMES
jgi:16S rRNA (uracil1498-N3)-methyltransferase